MAALRLPSVQPREGRGIRPGSQPRICRTGSIAALAAKRANRQGKVCERRLLSHGDIHTSMRPLPGRLSANRGRENRLRDG